ncbi:hypothetical protein L596_001022 [Steinernema carpocapsae]|uniref:Uncharacterized protein n=1 Tax=Steinernema carpocapsae TaxID=34508 RepID=A0A4U8UK74_STECR|nr:hypothetical protein L596_001022 [Steinernema carpocapsae]
MLEHSSQTFRVHCSVKKRSTLTLSLFLTYPSKSGTTMKTVAATQNPTPVISGPDNGTAICPKTPAAHKKESTSR